MIDLSEFTLGLVKDGKVLYTSKHSRIRPLVLLTMELKGKYSNCTLYDRVIGLGAARIICYSKLISKVITPVVSKPAKELLDSFNIELEAKEVVPFIMNNAKTGTCPMEVKAKQITDNEKYYFAVEKLLFP